MFSGIREPSGTDKKLALQAPGSCFWNIRACLDLCAINQAKMFPGVDGLCQHVEWLNSLLEDEKD